MKASRRGVSFSPVGNLVDHYGGEAGSRRRLGMHGNVIFRRAGDHAGATSRAPVQVDHHAIAGAHACLRSGASRKFDS